MSELFLLKWQPYQYNAKCKEKTCLIVAFTTLLQKRYEYHDVLYITENEEFILSANKMAAFITEI